MSDSKTSTVDGGNTGKTTALDRDLPVPFTYPEGFNAVANSLQFLPEELRVKTLAGFVQAMLTLVT
jgi:hypothetical protein